MVKEREVVWSKKEKNSNIMQKSCKNYEWKTQMDLKRW